MRVWPRLHAELQAVALLSVVWLSPQASQVVTRVYMWQPSGQASVSLLAVHVLELTQVPGGPHSQLLPQVMPAEPPQPWLSVQLTEDPWPGLQAGQEPLVDVEQEEPQPSARQVQVVVVV